LHVNAEMGVMSVADSESPVNAGQNYFPLVKANSQHFLPLTLEYFVLILEAKISPTFG
jgi:hypothetical protein